MRRVVALGRMGAAERNHRQRGGAAGRITPLVKWLLVANVAVFVVDLALAGKWGADYLTSEGVVRFPPIIGWGAFSVRSAVFEGRVWEFLTFQFLHGGLGHILFNSVGLYFFGPWMERWWGSLRFLVFYLLCGIAGGVFYTALVLAGFLPSGTMVGASAGIYGILIGVAVIAPNLRAQLLFPPIELSMRQLAMLILAIAAGSVIFRIGGNEGGEAGHLGGAIMGFLLVKFPFLLGSGTALRYPRDPNYQAKLRPRTVVDLKADDEVDAVLEKISRDGFQSLTEEDEKILKRAQERAERR